MFERFTERSRRVIVLAQDEARTLHHNAIGTEHLLLGLLREERGIAARVLGGLDVSLERVRKAVAGDARPGQGDDVEHGQIPFTPRAKRACELALRQALDLGHDFIGTEHLLLGLAREDQSVGARVLLEFGADAEKLRDEVVRTLEVPDRTREWATVLARLTEPARQAVLLAQHEARTLHHESIGTAHLLLGLLREEEEGVAGRVLERLGISLDGARTAVAGCVGPGDEVTDEQIPFTPQAKKVLELALDERRGLGPRPFIRTEDILLALSREKEGIAARVLVDLGADLVRIRVALGDTLSDPGMSEERTRKAIIRARSDPGDPRQASSPLISHRCARRLVEDALRRLDPKAEGRLGLQPWAAMVEEVLDANPDVEAA